MEGEGLVWLGGRRGGRKKERKGRVDEDGDGGGKVGSWKGGGGFTS